MQTEVPSERRDVYRAITDSIIKAIETGAGEYRMPWHSPERPASLPINATTHAAYHGINVVSLWVDALVRGYPSGLWASYQQWKSIGAQVRQGERGAMIVFYKPLPDSGEAQADGEGGHRYVAKASHVFNVAQVSGYQPDLALPVSEHMVNQTVEAFVAATGARIRKGFSMACYRRDLDDIEMPMPSWFTGPDGPQAYYAVLLHELTHWTGARHRLDREFGKRFGDQAYAFEELVAELGAAFLCAEIGIANEPRADHAAYVANWLKVLQQDPRAIFTAASKAQEAVAFLEQMTSA